MKLLNKNRKARENDAAITLPFFQRQLFNNFLASWCFTWVNLSNCVGTCAFRKQIEHTVVRVR